MEIKNRRTRRPPATEHAWDANLRYRENLSGTGKLIRLSRELGSIASDLGTTHSSSVHAWYVRANICAIALFNAPHPLLKCSPERIAEMMTRCLLRGQKRIKQLRQAGIDPQVAVTATPYYERCMKALEYREQQKQWIGENVVDQ